MKLEQFVRNIVNRLTTMGVNDSEIFAQDIIDELNNVAPTIRLQDVQNGNVEFYTIKREHTTGIDSFDNPTLLETELSPSPIRELETAQKIIRAHAYTTPNKLKRIDSFQMGEYARDGEKLLRCVSTFTNNETKGATFNQKEVKHLHSRPYVDGEVVYDNATDTYFRTTDSVYDGQTIPTEWEILYWAEVGSSGIEPNYLSFEDLRASQLIPNAFCVHNSTLYTTSDIGEIVIWYVPEWEDVTSPNVEIDLSTKAMSQVRQVVTQTLQQKLKMPVPPQEQNDE
jgi:hypothetical protein